MPDPNATPSVEQLLALVEELDESNERLRTKALDLMRLMEDAVTRQVAGERDIARLTAEVATLRARLAAVEASLIIRATRPLRRVFVRVRGQR